MQLHVLCDLSCKPVNRLVTQVLYNNGLHTKAVIEIEFHKYPFQKYEN